MDLALDRRLDYPEDVSRSRNDLWAYLVDRPAFGFQRAQRQVLDLEEGRFQEKPRDSCDIAVAKEELENGGAGLWGWLDGTLGHL